MQLNNQYHHFLLGVSSVSCKLKMPMDAKMEKTFESKRLRSSKNMLSLQQTTKQNRKSEYTKSCEKLKNIY